MRDLAVIAGGYQLFHLRLSKRLGQLTDRSTRSQKAWSNIVHNPAQIEKVEEAAQRTELIKHVTIGPLRRKSLGEKVADVHRGYFTQRLVLNKAAQPERDAAVRCLSAISIVLRVQPA